MEKENLNISHADQIYEVSRKDFGKLELCSIASPPFFKKYKKYYFLDFSWLMI